MKTVEEQHSIARQVVLAYVKTKKTFKLSEVKKSILKNGGIMRVGICYTVFEYLDDFDKNGVLSWKRDGNDIIFSVLKNKKKDYYEKFIF